MVQTLPKTFAKCRVGNSRVQFIASGATLGRRGSGDG